MICIFEPFYPSLRKKMPPLPAFWKGLSRAVNGSLAFTLAQIQCQAPAAHHLQGSESGVADGRTADPSRALRAQSVRPEALPSWNAPALPRCLLSPTAPCLPHPIFLVVFFISVRLRSPVLPGTFSRK